MLRIIVYSAMNMLGLVVRPCSLLRTQCAEWQVLEMINRSMFEVLEMQSIAVDQCSSY